MKPSLSSQPTTRASVSQPGKVMIESKKGLHTFLGKQIKYLLAQRACRECTYLSTSCRIVALRGEQRKQREEIKSDKE
jgi:hypothetical protein